MIYLPDEILEIIFNNLAISGTSRETYTDLEDVSRLRTLRAISLTSKRFYYLATPLLYRTLDFDIIGYDLLCDVLRTLCEQPSRRGLVQWIKLGAWIMEERAGLQRDVEYLQLYEANIVKLNLPASVADLLRSRLRQELVGGSPNTEISFTAEVALLFAMCTKIRQLTLSFQEILDSQSESLIHAVCGRYAIHQSNGMSSETLNKPSRLQFLQQLEIREWTIRQDEELPSFPLMCDLPALKTIRFSGFECFGRSPETTSPGRVTTIELSDAFIDDETVEFVLRAFPDLTNLSLEITPGLDSEDPFFSFEEFGKAVCQLGTKLSSLCVYICETSEPTTPIETLTPLDSLVSLSLPLDALINSALFTRSTTAAQSELHQATPFTSKLPTSLKCLRLGGPRRDLRWDLVAPRIVELIQDTSFENLERIEVLHHSMWLGKNTSPNDLSDTSWPERTTLSDELAGASWHVRREVRHIGPSEEYWDIFEGGPR